MPSIGRHLKRLKFGARVAAILVLGLIVMDLGDAACDPVTIPDGPVLLSPLPGGGDACADFCVPDCFCCSTTILVASSHPVGRAMQVTGQVLPTFDPPSAGFSPQVDHVPLESR
jgi:hypothetical protein